MPIRSFGKIVPILTKEHIWQTRQAAQQIAVDPPQQIHIIGQVAGLAKFGRFPEMKQNQRNKLIQAFPLFGFAT
jgi:dipeptide/tripeptide permease